MVMSIGRQEVAIWHRWNIFCGQAAKEKCYADKPETIKQLMFNIGDAITEIRTHTLEKVHDKRCDRMKHRNNYTSQQKNVVNLAKYQTIFNLLQF